MRARCLRIAKEGDDEGIAAARHEVDLVELLSSSPLSLAHTCLLYLPSSVVVPGEVHVANVEPEECEAQPDGHAIVAEVVLVHVCCRCRKCLFADVSRARSHHRVTLTARDAAC